MLLREVLEKKAVEQGDVRFFELGALSVDLKQTKREVTIKLSDFVIPLDDVPEEARTAIKHWSQMVDYWAVDWDFKEHVPQPMAVLSRAQRAKD
jgi:adenine-specific DNA-methyltransferase